MVFDVPSGPDVDSTYECLRCGEIVSARSHPGPCAECGGGFQDRAISLE